MKRTSTDCLNGKGKQKGKRKRPWISEGSIPRLERSVAEASAAVFTDEIYKEKSESDVFYEPETHKEAEKQKLFRSEHLLPSLPPSLSLSLLCPDSKAALNVVHKVKSNEVQLFIYVG